jgi:thymidylate synthase
MGSVMNNDFESNMQLIEIDQIASLINDLKTNPDSRRLMVNAWNVGELAQMVLPPCHYGFQVYTRELSIEEKWEQYTKSGLNIEINETPLELLMMLADEVNMVPDELIGNLGDTHIYLNHIEQAKEQIGRKLTDEERYNIWFNNNYETGMERYFDPNNLPDFDNEYYVPTPKRTREPFELPTVHVRDGIFCSSINDIILENYKSHPAIKAPLSN